MSDYLVHYGVKGMKWGVRHDRNRIGNPRRRHHEYTPVKRSASYNRERLKRIIKIGGIVAAGTIIAAGAIYVGKSGRFTKVASSGRGVVRSLLGKGKTKHVVLAKGGKGNVSNVTSSIAHKADISKVGKDISKINAQSISTINEGLKGTPEGSMNCACTSTSYILNSLFGKNTKALGYDDTLKKGLESSIVNGGLDSSIFGRVFNNVKTKDFSKNASFVYDLPSVKSGMSKVANKSTGILFVQKPFCGGHYVNYEKTAKGVTTIVDCQSGVISSLDDFEDDGWRMLKAFDLSNSSIKEDADSYLKYMVSGL